MNKTKIEWTNYSWSPVIGCRGGCFYCYGKRLNDRFKWIKDWTKPKFYPERLKEPYKIKKPSKIFVCSMADLFSDWIIDGMILKIIEVARENPRHTFQFLTKNPKRYLEFKFPKNCWLGATITGKEEILNGHYQIKALKKKDNFKFISFEPLLNKIDMDLSNIDLVIVGAMTGMGKKNVIPKKEWIASIKHPNIFYKENIKKYL